MSDQANNPASAAAPEVATPDVATPDAKSGTYVLVHGAWHGGWCWDVVARILRTHGHRVFTPTLTGLGERAHLLTPQTGLQTFIQDLVDVLDHNDVSNAILVGHSFGGLSLIGAADRVPQRIRQLVFLDAMVLSNGESAFSGLPADVVAKRTRLAMETSNGLTVPVPPARAFGVFDPEQVALIERHCTPHPFKTFTDPMVLQGPPGGTLPKVYIQCVDPIYAPLQDSRDFVRTRKDWAWDQIATGHDAMLSAPAELADKLLAFA
ncbi:alpha/beta fold hydrolase [Bordetella sp. FB-8]|uniref:alpha/beta fold hydrolase n=1 Tax=Bordetella sp. FB-8 TaxID=1159870 RepID=UPI00035CE2BF|nr:alpha/beta fold hydrolase [Bordetella sp. FB-8]